MITAIAVDDEPVALDIIRLHADKVPFLELKQVFHGAKDALTYLNNNPVDLVFLDIHMPDMTGLELAELISEHQQIIFTTAYAEHALKGFDLAATDYLLKPISYSRFLQACKLAEQRIGSAPPDTEALFVKDSYHWVKVPIDQITYIKAEDNYISMVEKNKRTLTRMTLQEISSRLPARQFMQIHKSYIIALAAIEKLEQHQVTVAGEKIPLSKAYKGELFQRLSL